MELLTTRRAGQQKLVDATNQALLAAEQAKLVASCKELKTRLKRQVAALDATKATIDEVTKGIEGYRALESQRDLVNQADAAARPAARSTRRN